jgi:hypothetical protein
LFSNLGLGIQIDLSYVLISVSPNTNTVVTPNEPGGHFMDIRVMADYEFVLIHFGQSVLSGLYVTPSAGIEYQGLDVDQQQPFSLVIGSKTVLLPLGLGLGLRFQRLTLEANARLGFIASYLESPASTGDSAGGLDLYTGAVARYWISSTLGVFFQGGYEFTRISMSGPGTRTIPSASPALMDALIFSGNAKGILGAVLGL